MSLLDDARREFTEMVASDDYSGASWLECRLCHVADGEHDDSCPAERIIRVLEAADAAVKDARREIPSRYLYPGHPLSDLALALYGRPTAIVREVVPKNDSLTGTTSSA